jgi:hypothetical protein
MPIIIPYEQTNRHFHKSEKRETSFSNIEEKNVWANLIRAENQSKNL